MICNEMYTIPDNVSNDDEGDLIDTSIKDLPSKFALINKPPDFGKTEDPFSSLGPITVRIFKKFNS